MAVAYASPRCSSGFKLLPFATMNSNNRILSPFIPGFSLGIGAIDDFSMARIPPSLYPGRLIFASLHSSSGGGTCVGRTTFQTCCRNLNKNTVTLVDYKVLVRANFGCALQTR